VQHLIVSKVHTQVQNSTKSHPNITKFRT